MPDRAAIEEGFAAERRLAKRVGADLQPGSGNRPFLKLDLKGKQFIWSVKTTTKENGEPAKSFRVTVDMLDEIYDAVVGEEGIGADIQTALVIEIHGAHGPKSFILMDLEDYFEQVESDMKLVTPTKDTIRRKTASVPAFLRDD